MNTTKNIAVLCPLAEDCKAKDCYHMTIHLQEMHPTAAVYCGKGTNGCPACEVIPSPLINKDTFSKEEFEI